VSLVSQLAVAATLKAQCLLIKLVTSLSCDVAQGSGPGDGSQGRKPRVMSRADWQREQISRILSSVTNEMSSVNAVASASSLSQSSDERQ